MSHSLSQRAFLHGTGEIYAPLRNTFLFAYCLSSFGMKMLIIVAFARINLAGDGPNIFGVVWPKVTYSISKTIFFKKRCNFNLDFMLCIGGKILQELCAL